MQYILVFSELVVIGAKSIVSEILVIENSGRYFKQEWYNYSEKRKHKKIHPLVITATKVGEVDNSINISVEKLIFYWLYRGFQVKELKLDLWELSLCEGMS